MKNEPRKLQKLTSFFHASEDEQLRREILEVNLRNLVIAGPLLFFSELFLLPFEHYILDIGSILIGFLILNIIIYPIVLYVSKHQGRMKERVLRVTTSLYILTFLGLGAGLSLRGLRTTDLVHVFIMTIIGVSIFFIMPAKDHLIILLVAVIPYLLIFPTLLYNQEILYVIYFNVALSAALSWLFGRFVYNTMVELFKDRKQLNEQNAILLDVARKDPMTGLLNHGALQDVLKRALEGATTKKKPLTIILFDIDGFKRVNDTYGHLIGDAVIQDIARVAFDCVGKDGYVGRYGGDEFLIILPEKDIIEAHEIALDVWKKMEGVKIAHEDEPITISGGIASCCDDEDISAARIIQRADENLFKAKLQGKNRFVSQGHKEIINL